MISINVGSASNSAKFIFEYERVDGGTERIEWEGVENARVEELLQTIRYMNTEDFEAVLENLRNNQD